MKIDLSNFSTKQDRIKHLIENKSFYIDRKKNEVKYSCNPYNSEIYFKSESAIKALHTNHKDDLSTGSIKRTIIGNTYYHMDSHDDVHVKGCFTVSIKQREGRIYHLHDHLNQTNAKVGKFSKVYEKEVSWKDLGVDREGSTISLMADSDILERLNKNIFLQYANGEIDQHSVGMQYVKIELAVNDINEKTEFKNWQSYIDLIENKERAEEKGYFFIIKEAKLFEISAVNDGSNVITQTIENIENPSKDSLNIDPSKDSQKQIEEKEKADKAFLLKMLNP